MADITHISTISFTVFTSSGIASSVKKSQWINFVSSPPFLPKIFTHETTLTIFVCGVFCSTGDIIAHLLLSQFLQEQ